VLTGNLSDKHKAARYNRLVEIEASAPEFAYGPVT
jgi:hypothetical protein